MIDAIERAALSRWEDLGLVGPRPARLTFVLDGHDVHRHGCVLFHAFRDTSDAPAFRGKIPRDGVARREVLEEHDLLKDLAEETPACAGALFPRALFAEDRGSGVATAETIPEGAPPHGPAGTLDAGRRWLHDFRTATGLLEGASAAVLEPYVRAAWAAAESSPAGAGRRIFERFAAELEGRRGTIPCAFGHGGLRAAHFRVGRSGSVCAESWECAEPRQPAWADPVHLALDVVVRGRNPEAWTEGEIVETFTAGFLGADAFAQLLRGFLRDTLAAANVPAHALSMAVPAVALLAAQRSARTGDAPPDPWGWRALARASLEPSVAEELRGALDEPPRPRASPG